PPATTTLCPPSLHDALPISDAAAFAQAVRLADTMPDCVVATDPAQAPLLAGLRRTLMNERGRARRLIRHILRQDERARGAAATRDRKSTRLNSSHVKISYAV